MKLSRPVVIRLALLSALVAVAVTLGLRTLPRIHRYRAVEEVCAAADRGAWQTVLEGSEDLVGNDPAGHRAAQCRCRALIETGALPACTSLMEELLSAPEAGDWLPDPLLTALTARQRQDAGDLIHAADLARRGALEYPLDPLLPIMELSLRTRIEDEASVLDEIERRLTERTDAGLPVPVRLELDLANHHIVRGEWERAISLLGDDPDRVPDDLVEPWFTSYTEALAGAGHADRLARAFDEWQKRGGQPAFLLARHAVLRSFHQIDDAEGTTIRMLREAISHADELRGQPILELAYIRLIASLVVGGKHEEALRLYDQATEELGGLEVIDRDDILRSATQAMLGEEGLAQATGTLRFRIAGARGGDRMLVSPDVQSPVDTAYPSIALPASGQVAVTRGVGSWPARWVLRAADGQTVGSGAAWVRPDEVVDVPVERRDEDAREAVPAPLRGRSPAAAEARGRRVFQVILDCGEWRTIRYGIARGELPFFSYAVAYGRRAVLESDPPATAIAISKLVFPQKQGTRSFPELLVQLGREIEGLNFVGRNPFGGLSWIVPEETQLFETFARHGLSTVNLLHSHGSLQVGRNAQVVGPGDQVRELAAYRSSRALDAEESALLLPAPTGGASDEDNERMVPLLEEMAADFDVVNELATEPGLDFVTIRVASLDILTHSRFQDLQRTGQDDGNLLLYRAYRYVDRRLTELLGRLGPSDVLIVMSDHGIRTPLEHDHRALFLVLGPGIEPGRIPGSPPIQEVSGWVADLLGVDVDWPGTGSQSWIQPPASTAHEAAAGAGAEAAAVR